MKLGEPTQTFASPGEALEHHGVKGMRWGVRKKEDLVGRDAARLNVGAKGNTPLLITAKPSASTGDASNAVSAEKLAKQQRRAEEFLKRADVMGTRASELKLQNEAIGDTKNPVKLYTKYANNQTRVQFEKSQKQAIRDAEAVHHGKMTTKQKQVVAGALAVGGILAVGVIYGQVAKGQQSGAFNSYKLLLNARRKGLDVPFNVNKELSGKMSASEILSKVSKQVNPGYSTPGGQMNCRRSTYTHELRRRGFDVHATTSSMGWGQSESGVINAVTPGATNFYNKMSMSRAVVDKGRDTVATGDVRSSPLKKILVEGLGTDAQSSVARVVAAVKAGKSPAELLNATESSSKKVLEELAKQPNGSRGEVLFKFPGFGHSMAYEVIDGVPHIFDSQKANHYHAAGKMVESKWDGFHSAEITRLDNVDLDLNFLTRWATNN